MIKTITRTLRHLGELITSGALPRYQSAYPNDLPVAPVSASPGVVARAAQDYSAMVRDIRFEFFTTLAKTPISTPKIVLTGSTAVDINSALTCLYTKSDGHPIFSIKVQPLVTKLESLKEELGLTLEYYKEQATSHVKRSS